MLRRIESIFHRKTAWVFSLRTVAAALIALVMAFALRLQQPQWAMMTVFIVSQPIAGMVISKGLFRLTGTLVGAIAAITITAATHDVQWAFVAAVALWVAACTFAASMLRNPESYGAALAGYTAIIIALPAFGEQHLLFEFAIARCTEITLGIVCAGLASRFFRPQLARAALVDGLEKCIGDLARYAANALGGAEHAELRAAQRKLIADTQALSAMRAHARLEAPSLVTHGRQSRHTIGQLMSCLSVINVLVAHRVSRDAAWRALRSDLKDVLDAMAADGLDDIRALLDRLAAIESKIAQLRERAWEDDPVGMMARLTLVGEFLDGLKAAMNGLAALRTRSQADKGDKEPPALLVHRDRNAAAINAVRAAIATTLMTSYWMATKHADAAAAAIIVAVVCSLFASMPNSVQASWGFFKGTLAAVPFAFVVSQLILPLFPGLFWFAVFVTPVLVPAAFLMADSRRSGPATAFAINFIVFLKPHEAMAYAPRTFVESSVAVLGGILIGLLVFILVLPKRPQSAVRGLMRALRADIVRLCLRDRVPNHSAFVSLAYDRVNQLMLLLRAIKGSDEQILDDALSTVTLGLEVIRLRKIMQQAGMHQRGLDQTGLDSFGTGLIRSSLGELARMMSVRMEGEASIARFVATTRRSASEILEAGSTPSALQAAASMRLLAVVMEDHPSLVAARGPE